MQIQRIQSIFLLLSAIFMCLFLFIPFSFAGHSALSIRPTDFYYMLIPAATSALLFFIDIFLYNNFRFQKIVLLIAVMLTVVSLALTIYCNAEVDGTLKGGICMPIVAIISAFIAMKRIRHDEQLIRASNRLL